MSDLSFLRWRSNELRSHVVQETSVLKQIKAWAAVDPETHKREIECQTEILYLYERLLKKREDKILKLQEEATRR